MEVSEKPRQLHARPRGSATARTTIALPHAADELRELAVLTEHTTTSMVDREEKPIAFVGRSRDDLRAFPEAARRRAGFELDQVQRGENPSDGKPMPSVGAGVVEIRIRTELQHRVFYIASFPEAVYVLHAFQKKTRKTSKQDIELGRQRLAELTDERRRRT